MEGKTFTLTSDQYNAISKWADNHKCSCRHGNRPSKSCCGGEISYIFTPTTIGTAISAQCFCGQELVLDTF